MKKYFYSLLIAGSGVLGAIFANDYVVKEKSAKIDNEIAVNRSAAKDIQVVLASCYKWTQTGQYNWQGESELKKPELAKLSRNQLEKLEEQRKTKQRELDETKTKLILFYKGR